MESVKNYIINLILICFLVQITGLLVSAERYKKIFRFVSSIIFISVMVSFPTDKIIFDIKEFNFEAGQYEYKFDDNPVKEKFQNDISRKIEEDLKNKFNIDSKVDAKTDFEKITLEIILDTSLNDVDTIGKYIRDNYCTESDEVYIHNEPDI